MPRCFVFAIGGTGSRVLRSLTHLLAAGVKPNANFSIVPIVIDPHAGNKDLRRTVSLMGLYKKIRDDVKPEGFFPIEIERLSDAAQNTSISPEFTFELDGANSEFDKYLDHMRMGKENAALVDLLFSGYSKGSDKKFCKLLKIKMDIGFVGNPNVGSVVLNQIVESDIYNAFKTAFTLQAGDRIFIISSIFGGTGAAGFPCLLKNIRKDAALKDAIVGAVTVLPYFKLPDSEDSDIKYSDFVAKTKSALHYYNGNITGNKSVNAMYYIGDQLPGNPYKNDPGYDGQQNNANFIELASALTIIDFLSMQGDMLKKTEPQYRIFGIKKNVPKPRFSDLMEEHQKLLSKSLSQFMLFRKYMEENFDASKSQGWNSEMPKIEKTYRKDTFYKNSLGPFFKDFYDWLTELSDNDRGFAPFNLATQEEKAATTLEEKAKAKKVDLHSVISDKPIERGFLGRNAISYDDYETELNPLAKTERGKSTFDSSDKKLLDIFYKTTQKLVTNIYKLPG